MPINQPMEPPIKISTATFSLTMNPTASKAGDISLPKKNILLPLSIAVSRLPLRIPANEINPLNAPPTRAPLIIDVALSDSASSCPASSTDAHANPSGYCKLSSFFTMKTCLIGIINNIPSSPPVKAITVVRYISNDCQTPININAGMVKIIPAARDSPAEAAV